jgi:general nucleoside transport system permease protein
VGANKMQRVVQVPSALITALNGLVVVFVVSSDIIRKRRQRRRLANARHEDNPPPQPNDKTINQVEAGT